MVKVYTSGNYFFMDKGSGSIILSDVKSNVVVRIVESEEGAEKFLFESPQLGRHEILLSQLQDESASAYTLESFNTFYRSQTGFSLAATQSLPLGWVAASDTTYTSGSPFAVSSGVDTVLDWNNDSIIETYAPNGETVADLIDDTNNRIKTSMVGNAYMLRTTFKAVPAQSARVLTVEYSIGADVNNKIVIDSRSSELRTSGVATNISMSTLIYTLATFDTNGMQLILNATTDVDIYDQSFVMAQIN